MAYAAGIDLGTTYSAAAVASEGRVEVFELGTRRAAIPSVVLLAPDGSLIVGEAADRRAMHEAGRAAREFKRRLGDPTPILLGGTPYGAETLTAHLLADIVARITAERGQPPESITVTHPAAYGPYKMEVMEQAAHLADVGPVNFMPEPVAAAIHYARGEALAVGELVAVYDFGGGTIDLAVLRRTADGFELVGDPEGMERLGGVDLDAAVFAHVRSVVGDDLDSLDRTDPTVLSAMAALRVACRDAKEALSADTETVIPVMLPGIHTDVRLIRTEFEALIRPRIEETLRALERVVRSAGLGFDELSRVLLVGGASRIPLVAEMVGATTGRPIALDANPKLSVALGAAWHEDEDEEDDEDEEQEEGREGEEQEPVGVGPSKSEPAETAAPPQELVPTGGGTPDRAAPVGGGGGKKRWLWVAGAAVVGVLGIGGYLVATGGNGGEDPSSDTPQEAASQTSVVDDSTSPATTVTSEPTETPTTEAALPDLSGADIEVMGPGTEDRAADTQRAIDAQFSDPTGAAVTYVPVADIETELELRMASGDVPDVALVPAALVESLAESGAIVPLGDLGIDLTAVEDLFGFFLSNAGSWGEDRYGVPTSLFDIKDLVWYNVASFETQGYQIPQSMDELIQLSDRMVDDGFTPWCLASESGDATGWPLTDWMETMVLRTAGAETYDLWTYHDIPFDDPAVLAAAERLEEIFFAEGYLAIDPAEVPSTNFGDAFGWLFGDSKCLMYRQGSFMTFFVDDFDVADLAGAFHLPADSSIGTDANVRVLVAFNSDPATRALASAFMEPELPCELSGDLLLRAFMAHPGVEASCYPDGSRDAATGVIASIRSDTVRFDASDQMPTDVTNAFYNAVNTWMEQGPGSIESLFAEVEAAW